MIKASLSAFSGSTPTQSPNPGGNHSQVHPKLQQGHTQAAPFAPDTKPCNQPHCHHCQERVLHIVPGDPGITWGDILRDVSHYDPSNLGTISRGSDNWRKIDFGSTTFHTVVDSENCILICIWTMIPLDLAASVSTLKEEEEERDIEEPLSKYVRSHCTCLHMSARLERDVTEVLRRLREPPAYTSSGLETSREEWESRDIFRRCYRCPSEYRIGIETISKANLDSEGTGSSLNLILHRWIDLGSLQLEASEEFRSLATAQVCCGCDAAVVTSPRKRHWLQIPEICVRFDEAYEKHNAARRGL